jgi:hypothetical protein
MILARIHKIEQNAGSDPAAAGLFILSKVRHRETQ